jgi:hypothetical protein
MPTAPTGQNIAEIRRAPTLLGNALQFGDSFINDRITDYGGSRRATRRDRVSYRQHLHMTNSEGQPPPAVGAYWIKEEDYPALLQLFDDGDKMPPSWKEWLKMAEEMEQGLKAYGHVVLRVFIDPATFPDWCAAHGTSPGSAGRRKFVAAAVTERYGRQA